MLRKEVRLDESTKAGLIQVLADLREALEDHSEGSVTRLVRKALMIAALSHDTTYEMLFEIHLLGLDAWAKAGNKTIWERRGVDDNDYVANAHSTDRERLDSTIEARPLDDVERMVTVLAGLEQRFAGTGEHERAFMLQKLEGERILGRIRARVALFVARFHQAAAPHLASEAISGKGNKVFIGHGRSGAWRDLAAFLETRLGLTWDEFNRESTAGVAIIDRLQQMLNDACFGFVVMTAEDTQRDGTAQARQNVVHEVGLFQGRLGFRRAIILLEEGCAEFSNIVGLGQIRYPAGNLLGSAEEIRRVLERESVLAARP